MAKQERLGIPHHKTDVSNGGLVVIKLVYIKGPFPASNMILYIRRILLADNL